MHVWLTKLPVSHVQHFVRRYLRAGRPPNKMSEESEDEVPLYEAAVNGDVEASVLVIRATGQL